VAPPPSGRAWRETLLQEVDQLIVARRAEADAIRHAQKGASSPAESRQAIRTLLGWPLADFVSQPSREAEETPAVEDDLGKVLRLRISTLPGVSTYALLCLPPGPGPFPCVIAQHGGLGTPEMLLGLTGNSENYRNFGRRLRARGFAVLAPQLCLSWGADWGPKRDQIDLENSLRHLGGSLAALETTRILRCLDYLDAHPAIATGRIGMAGLSYGGFYTLIAAALDVRIRAAYCSCFLNHRYTYPWGDLVWRGSAFQFLDAEIATLIAPRPLYADIGLSDEVFLSDGVPPVADEIKDAFRRAGSVENFVFQAREGGHEFDPADGPLDFLQENLAG